jgi:phosphonate utilization transcriptional regulator
MPRHRLSPEAPEAPSALASGVASAAASTPGNALLGGHSPPAQASTQGVLSLLRSQSLAGAVLDEVRQRIVSGALVPGAKLTEATLAQELGVSRGPIREALRMLEEAGLVRQEKNRGVFVRELPLSEALELFELRALIDEAAGRRLAASATPQQLKHLRGLVDEMERATKTQALDEYHALNLAFHDAVVAFAGNAKMTALYRRLFDELALLRRRNLDDERGLPASAREHRAILKAIAAGDALAAGSALQQHAMDSRARIAAQYAAPPLQPSLAPALARG